MNKRFGARAVGDGQIHRVLVVDDHPDAAEITCLMLRALGHVCVAARSGEEGLAAAESLHPDIALLDIGMPDLSGYELARRLRLLFGPSLYLAAITGWGEGRDRELAFEAGFDDHVVKPASGAVIREILGHAEHRVAAALS